MGLRRRLSGEWCGKACAWASENGFLELPAGLELGASGLCGEHVYTVVLQGLFKLELNVLLASKL